MTKPRKLHQLIGTINHCFPGKATSKQGKNQPFYCLIIQQQSLFTGKSEASIYVFPNLVRPEIGKVLEQNTYQNKKYLFDCEKRTRGGRLREGKEL